MAGREPPAASSTHPRPASTAAPSSGFDASKQGTIPPSSLYAPPKDEPIVVIGFVSPAVGLGVFAARDIAKGEFILHEKPVMVAAFNEKDSDNRDDMRAQEEAVRLAQAGPCHLALDLAFPHLAAGTGHVPCGFDNAADADADADADDDADDDADAEANADADVPMSEIGVNLVHGRLPAQPSPQGFRQYVQALQVAENPGRAQRRNVCRDFFKHYAFQVRAAKLAAGAAPSRAPSKACIYLLGSLINHCCVGNPGPNCEFQIGPGGLAKFVERDAIAVKARCDIKAGEELTFNYGKQHKGFHCQCKTCERKPPGRDELCIML